MKTSMRPGRLSICLVAVLLFLPGCGRGGESSSSSEGGKSGGTLVIGLIGEPDSMNPLLTPAANAKDIYERIFLRLVAEQDDFLHFEPQLAESWEIADDHRSITFHLRRDVRWADGVPTTAHDVRFTWILQMDPQIPFVRRSTKENIADVEVVDDYTVRFHYSKPYPPVYQLMDANDGTPVLPKHVLETIDPAAITEAPFNRRPLGNGPYMLESWNAQESVVLIRNPDFCDAPEPFVDRIVWKIVPDQANLLLQLEKGEIDVMEAVPPKEARRLIEGESAVRIHEYPSRSYSYIGWNARHEPFNNRNVRRALTMAIDRKGILDALYYGFARPLKSPIHPLLWAHKADIEDLPYDPEAARRLLALEGWSDGDGDGWLDKDGTTFEFELVTNRENQIRKDIQVMVQSQLKEIGVRVKPVEIEWTVLLEKFKRRDFQATVGGWRAGTKVDMTQIWHSSSIGEDGFNRVFYMNPTADSLNDAAKVMLDTEAAKPLWHRWQSIVFQDQPYTFLGVSSALVGINSRVRGAEPNAMSAYQNVHEWWIPREERKYPATSKNGPPR